MSTGQGDSQADKRAACIDLPCLWLIVLMDNHKENGREVHSHGCAARASPLGEQRKSWRLRIGKLRMCARRYLL